MPIHSGFVFTPAVLKQVYDKNKNIFKGKGPRGGELGDIYNLSKTIYEESRKHVTDTAKRAHLDKPGGDVKRFTDWLRNLTAKGKHHALGSTYPGKDPSTEKELSAPVLSSGEVDPRARFIAYQQQRRKDRGRKAANLSPASGASILTS